MVSPPKSILFLKHAGELAQEPYGMLHDRRKGIKPFWNLNIQLHQKNEKAECLPEINLKTTVRTLSLSDSLQFK